MYIAGNLDRISKSEKCKSQLIHIVQTKTDWFQGVEFHSKSCWKTIVFPLEMALGKYLLIKTGDLSNVVSLLYYSDTVYRGKMLRFRHFYPFLFQEEFFFRVGITPTLCGSGPLWMQGLLPRLTIKTYLASLRTLLGILRTSVQIVWHLANSRNTSFLKVTRIDSANGGHLL